MGKKLYPKSNITIECSLEMDDDSVIRVFLEEICLISQNYDRKDRCHYSYWNASGVFVDANKAKYWVDFFKLPYPWKKLWQKLGPKEKSVRQRQQIRGRVRHTPFKLPLPINPKNVVWEESSSIDNVVSDAVDAPVPPVQRDKRAAHPFYWHAQRRTKRAVRPPGLAGAP